MQQRRHLSRVDLLRRSCLPWPSSGPGAMPRCRLLRLRLLAAAGSVGTRHGACEAAVAQLVVAVGKGASAERVAGSCPEK